MNNTILADKYPTLVSLIDDWYEATSFMSVTTLTMKVPEYQKLIDYCESNKEEFAKYCLDYLTNIGGNRTISLLIDKLIGIPLIFKDNYAGPTWKSTINTYKRVLNNFLADKLVKNNDGYIIILINI